MPPQSIPHAMQPYATGQDTLAYNRMKEWQDCAGNRLSSHDNMYHDGAGNPRSGKPMYPTLSQCQGYGMGKARTVNPNNWRHRSNPIITFAEAGWTDANLDGGTEMTPTYWELPDAATIKSHGVKVGTTRDLFEFDIDSQCNDVDDHVIQNWDTLSCIPCYICQMYMRNKGRHIGGNNTDPQGKTPNIGNNGPPGSGGKKTRAPMCITCYGYACPSGSSAAAPWASLFSWSSSSSSSRRSRKRNRCTSASSTPRRTRARAPAFPAPGSTPPPTSTWGI